MTSEQQKKAKEIAEKFSNMTDEELLNLPEVDDPSINAFVDGYMQFLNDHCKANFNKSFDEICEDINNFNSEEFKRKPTDFKELFKNDKIKEDRK